MVRNQDDVAAGKLPAGKTFHEQVFRDASMHNQRDKAERGKEQAGAAGKFTSDFQRKHRTSEQQEHAYPGQTNPAYLVAQDQQFGGASVAR